jgi:hypothetical protein
LFFRRTGRIRQFNGQPHYHAVSQFQGIVKGPNLNVRLHKLTFTFSEILPNYSPADLTKFIGENILKTDFQFFQNCFQLIQCQMMLAMFNAKECLMGNPNLFGKSHIGKTAPFFSQERSQLPVKVASHARKVAKTP